MARNITEIEDNIRIVEEELQRLKEERTFVGYEIQNKILQSVFDQIQPGMFLRIGNESFSQFICVKTAKLNYKTDKWNGHIELFPVLDTKFPNFSIQAYDDYTLIDIQDSSSSPSIYIKIGSDDVLDEWSIITEIDFLKILDQAKILNMDAQRILKL